ncbi:MAG: molybdopterin molybdotransferase MoeA [Chloroflexi bacterium]|nr:molybdopterin molybdotransferase MoeA [Chloroflexota bacterium]
MPEFLNLLLPSQALNKLSEAISFKPSEEIVSTKDALGRVISHPVIAPHPLPTFSRSAVDGYAVKARDTFGASESAPAYLRIIGEVPMGGSYQDEVNPGECVLIHTGGMLPVGIDAVVMLEYTQIIKESDVEILRAVAVGENVIMAGEDVEAGQVVLQSGTVLRPAELGGLMALGLTSVSVYQKLKVAIISTGDEIVPPEKILQPGQVRDINSYSLAGLVQNAGAEALVLGIIPDKEEALYQKVQEALALSDLVLITAGSSASMRDLTAKVITQLGPPGVLVHGINIRPGKPTIFGICRGKPVIGLPGNPISALVIGWLLVDPIIRKMSGIIQRLSKPVIYARLSANIPSQAGREDWIPVELVEQDDGILAKPIFFKSNLIFNLARADGLLCIPADQTGLLAGQNVEVYLY